MLKKKSHIVKYNKLMVVDSYFKMSLVINTYTGWGEPFKIPSLYSTGLSKDEINQTSISPFDVTLNVIN